MQKPTIEILGKINQNSNKNKDEVFTKLYRYLLRPDIYYVAYKNLYANNGAATKGVDNDTADGFSESKVEKIIKSLMDGSYKPKPARRTYIAKANGKLRPLGIPTFTDKLVQEVLRMILEAVYEPVFSIYSHGFRPNKSCHTALKDLKRNFNGARWFIEGDIKGCFDNINHKTLVEIINAKVKDAKFIQLIWKFLKAGYLEEWKYNKTYSGTPQGGIVSPILANIYLNELDKKVEQMSVDFNKPRAKARTTEYNLLVKRVKALRKKIDKPCNLEKRPELLRELSAMRTAMMKLPSKSQTDKQIKYIRYADDFIMGIKGDKADCELIKSELKTFIGDRLKMELSEEKTLITHSSNTARFLGYDIKVRRCEIIRQVIGRDTRRTLNNMTDLSIPLKDKVEKFLFKIKAVKVENGILVPVYRTDLIRLTDLEILATYNAELRGICNYYNLAGDYYKLSYFAYLMEYSCLKTLATKRKKFSVGKIIAHYKDRKGGWCIPYETKNGIKQMYFANFTDCKKERKPEEEITTKPNIYKLSRTAFEDRLKAKVCEICGSDNSKQYEIHHVNKVKNLKGKEHWERIMIAKRRKTLVVCYDCHLKIHGKKRQEND